MGHHDQGLACFFYQRIEQLQHLLSGIQIQITGRLIGKNDIRIMNQRAGNRDPLLFPAG